ncbi:MAG: SDR family oxidoreductase [Actinomycetota bacterium]
MQKTFVITGANRGLGLAYTRSLLQRGERVIVTVRTGSDAQALEEVAATSASSLTILESHLDTDSAIEKLGSDVRAATDHIDVLINNAGMLTEDSIDAVRFDDVLANFHVNAAVPVVVVQQLLPLLRAAESGTVVNISSSFASISRKQHGMPTRYAYSMSKAALNMFTRTLAAELHDGPITVVSIHPGWVRTDLGGPEAQLDPAEAADAVLDTINTLEPSHHGSFLLWDGRTFDW